MILRPDQFEAGNPVAWESELTELLDELLETQEEMLSLLGQKRQAMTKRDLPKLESLHPQEEALCRRLMNYQQRRSDVLAVAKQAKLPDTDLTQLSKTVLIDKKAPVHSKVKEATERSIRLKHQSLTNWIIAQRNLLHVSQLLEIIATGGNQVPTYGGREESAPNGFVLDQEA